MSDKILWTGLTLVAISLTQLFQAPHGLAIGLIGACVMILGTVLRWFDK